MCFHIFLRLHEQDDVGAIAARLADVDNRLVQNDEQMAYIK